MKALPTIALGMLTAFLALLPLVSITAAATVSVSVSPTNPSGETALSITGTVSPAPGAGVNAFIQVFNPAGKTVASSVAAVDPTAGTYSNSFTTGGTTLWTTGTYTISVNAAGVTGTNSFTYTATIITPPPSTNINALRVWVQASTPVFPGDTVQIATLVEWVANGSLATTHFQTAHYHTPTNGLVNLGAATTIHKGFYFWTITLPANAATGTYFVHVWVNNSGPEGQGLGAFTVSPSLASGASQQQILTAVNGVSSSLASSLGQITTALTTLQGAVVQLQTAATQTQTAAAAAQKAASDLSASVGTITTGVQSSQTYILVVAALAAITLVLELAILVRKLS